MFRKILVATHGTEGAKKAELCAIGLARALGAEIHALYVIHKGWGSLVGIEWLHPSQVRMEFYRYAEKELYRRAGEVLDDLTRRGEGVDITTAVSVGEPFEVIAKTARDLDADLIVIGPAGSGRSEEYRARIPLKRLLKKAPCPVLVATEPAAVRRRPVKTVFSGETVTVK